MMINNITETIVPMIISILRWWDSIFLVLARGKCCLFFFPRDTEKFYIPYFPSKL